MSDGGLSMFETVKQHGEDIEKLKEADRKHDERLEGIENAQREFKVQIESIKSSQQSLEFTVMKDGQQTRDLLTKFVDHYFSTDEKKFKSQEKVALKKLGTKEKIWLAVIGSLVGSGGILMSIAAILQIFN